MGHSVRRARRSIGVVSALAIAASLVVAAPVVSPASAAEQIAIGATTIAQPTAGGRYVYVSTTGSDTHTEYKEWMNGGDGGYREYSRLSCLTNADWATTTSQEVCPEPDRANPLRTIKLAIRVARPGDVIVVRGGTYAEAAGYGAVPATSAAPIVLQAMPNERVTLSGTLLLKGPDHWTVYGIRFVYSSTIQTGQTVVGISGGRGWRLLNNEVRGSRGVANVLVNSLKPASTTTAAKAAAAPNDFVIRGNTIHTNAGTGTHGTFHNIYLMSTVYSSGGVIERNLFGNAPRGAHIKAAAASASTADQSPRNVVIRYNTMWGSASGVTIGLKATGIVVERNIIAHQINGTQYDGGVKTYKLENPGSNAVRDNLISGYARVIEEDGGVTEHIYARRNSTAATKFTGTVSGGDLSPVWYSQRSVYGREAG